MNLEHALGFTGWRAVLAGVWCAVVLALLTLLLWPATVLAAAQPPPPAPSPWAAWTTPAAVFGGISMVVAFIAWTIRQDRRIESAEGLRKLLLGDPSAGVAGMLEQMRHEMVSQHDCANRHGEADMARRKSVGKAYKAVRALEKRVIRGEKQALELRGDIKAVREDVAEVKAGMKQLLERKEG